MSSQTFGEVDLNSPGYEFLRSHRSMNNLYMKLVALNYQRDFCPLYKCQPIHKYYFSFPSEKPNEQVFIFTCLCAWLIKEKCQMNLDLSPEDYQEVDTAINIIFEALKLLLSLDGEQERRSVESVINFAPARLKQGYGPEVIWTISILADRALELYVEAVPGLGRPQISYHDKQVSDAATMRALLNSITVGQPIVGGGLTTRPLGSYQIDDSSLLLEGAEERSAMKQETADLAIFEPNQWCQQVEKDRQVLEATFKQTDTTELDTFDLRGQILAAKKAKQATWNFSNQSRSLLEMIATRIDRQLQIINGREKFMQANLQKQFDEFLQIWRVYNEQSKKNTSLMKQVSAKTDLFETHLARFKSIGSQMEARTKELNDGTKLRELQGVVDSLESESRELDLKVSLLLMVYAKKRSREQGIARQVGGK